MVIYIHVPFCIRKCAYCDFLSAPGDGKTRSEYVEALKKEICHYGRIYGTMGRNLIVSSIFFGGGTPSLLEKEQIASIMTCLKDNFNIEESAEITMECNPGTLTADNLMGYRNTGVNRLSIGLQSANDTELQAIGRIHNFQQFMSCYDLARKCGFDNINIDLMSALPYQTLESYEETIKKVLEIKPEHISAYSLILEEGTSLYDRIEELEISGQPTGLPDEDTEREMYYMTKRLLEEAGYNRYEISNYARDGYECRHNTAYWERDDYLGIGIGAASCMDNVRTKNICDINEYIRIVPDGARDEQETDVLTRQDMMAEFMFLGLRMMRGVSRKAFSKLFGVDYNHIYGEITAKLIDEGLLESAEDNDRLWLTTLGIDVSNMVLAQFIVDQAPDK